MIIITITHLLTSSWNYHSKTLLDDDLMINYRRFILYIYIYAYIYIYVHIYIYVGKDKTI